MSESVPVIHLSFKTSTRHAISDTDQKTDQNVAHFYTTTQQKSGDVFARGVVRSFVRSFSHTTAGIQHILTKLEVQKEESTEKVLGYITLSYDPAQMCN